MPLPPPVTTAALPEISVTGVFLFQIVVMPKGDAVSPRLGGARKTDRSIEPDAGSATDLLFLLA
jgi:hypothetical protein